ncbi:hypothetical protein N7462_006235 [Penicillium macrosclerotiorum]|uniref:uncharacterized protein n=1 Tax=Penicillium macrosclerotiorum TaxID=303699 RepID=UPI002547806E|nr:uncharacterized protein N7462_006235 [Penicillium macrosclerotiorum]KAJ5683070.1 hypothetical protein N7462_006235 [Penicillium macrosclerotiorum]
MFKLPSRFPRIFGVRYLYGPWLALVRGQYRQPSSWALLNHRRLSPPPEEYRAGAMKPLPKWDHLTKLADLRIKFTGFPLSKLPQRWHRCLSQFLGPRGGAEKNNPIHQSHHNPRDKEYVVTVRIRVNGKQRTCHVYRDGTGTAHKYDKKH